MRLISATSAVIVANVGGPTPRAYSYVGPAKIRESIAEYPEGTPISCASGLLAWLQQQDDWAGEVLVATFTVALDQSLWIAPRRTEHVACARGESVLAAGELTLRGQPQPEVVGATNQSTGYCPEPSCWEAARLAFGAVGIPCPQELTYSYTFRLCEGCGERNLIKDDWFECAICGDELPREWNF